VVNAVEVVEAQVFLEVAPQAGKGGVQVAGKGGSPALVEDRVVQCLDVAVGLRAPGANAGVPCLQGADRL
jgi:hypothetical protein